jgi:hypothetical protein
LSGLRAIEIGSEVGPEHIAIAPDGTLYAAMASGNLVRMAADGAKHEVFANTGGRVLGFDFDAQGRMIAADAMKGLLLWARLRHRREWTSHNRPAGPNRRLSRDRRRDGNRGPPLHPQSARA